jgi:hypothetical protein
MDIESKKRIVNDGKVFNIPIYKSNNRNLINIWEIHLYILYVCKTYTIESFLNLLIELYHMSKYYKYQNSYIFIYILFISYHYNKIIDRFIRILVNEMPVIFKLVKKIDKEYFNNMKISPDMYNIYPIITEFEYDNESIYYFSQINIDFNNNYANNTSADKKIIDVKIGDLNETDFKNYILDLKDEKISAEEIKYTQSLKKTILRR